jgi:tRNA/tmRNA/rRNA uracil-C5-methylase (TrmA/RlmC/RlmD family)
VREPHVRGPTLNDAAGESAYEVGSVLEVDLGAPAAGGGFVARDPNGRVLFVRHGLPGERVRAIVTEAHATYARADAIAIIEASSARVVPPCPHARPGGCGGCDYQHVTLQEQRRLKSALIAAQFGRVRGLDASLEVEAVEEGDGLHTRTRVRFAVGPRGELSMRAHRSHDLVTVNSCPLGVDALADLSALAVRVLPGDELEVVALSRDDEPTAWVRRRVAHAGRELSVLDGPGVTARQHVDVRGARHGVSAGVFWQVHREASSVLVEAVLEGLKLRAGDRVADLYCGAGLFTRAAADVVGPRGLVVGLDNSKAAVSDANFVLRELPWARAVSSRVDHASTTRAVAECTHVVMDPPRSGVDQGALDAVSDAPTVRTVVSVSCDPASCARDLGRLMARGWRVEGARAFDLFEMTEHVEIVAVLRR